MAPTIAAVECLEGPRLSSPFARAGGEFVSDSEYIPLQITTDLTRQREGNILFEKAGARRDILFHPASSRAAIVTCGGLCPGLNNVIRSLVLTLECHYGLAGILGVRYGYHGLNPAHGDEPLELHAGLVSDIHELGGTILGTSRGPEDPAVMVDTLRRWGVRMLFPVGGDGTQRGALALSEEARRQGYALAVVGVPKTIDNDIQHVSRTFGYGTAIEAARAVIDIAHTEARAVINGVGLVKLMGRDSGFIAAGATLASGEVNYCLIPEQKLLLDGASGLLRVLEERLARKRHAVIVVAEGAGQDLDGLPATERDASGNVKHADIGVFLRDRLTAHFRTLGQPINVRYIDPSYTIRGLAANTYDAMLCDALARDAAHAAMSGRTGMIIGMVHNRMVHVPTKLAIESRKKVKLSGELWRNVQTVTGQPAGWGA
jgi:6-phosphofructokinase 1